LGNSAAIKSIDSETKPGQDKQFTEAGVWESPIDMEEIKNRLKDLHDSSRKRIIDILSQQAYKG
jgi:hypothetical protein